MWCYAIASATVDALRNAPPSEEMIGGDPDPLPPVVARGEKKRVELLAQVREPPACTSFCENTARSPRACCTETEGLGAQADMKRKTGFVPSHLRLNAPNQTAGFPLINMASARVWIAKYEDPPTSSELALADLRAPTFGSAAAIKVRAVPRTPVLTDVPCGRYMYSMAYIYVRHIYAVPCARPHSRRAFSTPVLTGCGIRTAYHIGALTHSRRAASQAQDHGLHPLALEDALQPVDAAVT